jgi:CO/xanthine dehydrogenase FAD-binding subunit
LAKPERHCVIRYAKPKTVEEALLLLKQDRWRILAGGTDFYPSQGTRPFRESVLDINGLRLLRGITRTPEHIIFGARTTWTDIVRDATLPAAFDAFKHAAREVGSVQIQNSGTIAGNLCNASPAADGMPPLLVLDAEVELRSAEAVRYVPLTGFILGNRKTALRPDELVTAIRVPASALDGRSAFLKLGARRYLVISIAMVAARVVTLEDGTIRQAVVAAGACSAVAQRLPDVEAALSGAHASEIAAVTEQVELSGLAPIDDVRGTADYRMEAARELIVRAVTAAILPAKDARAA